VRFILVAATKDLHRRLADRASLAIWLGIPILLGSLMSLVMGGDGPPRARVLVADRDDTVISRVLLTAAAGGAGSTNPVDVEEVTQEDGQRRIDEGDATALLVVPQGFQAAIVNGTPAQLTLVTNPSERILPRIVQEGLEIGVEGVFYLQRMFGPTLRRMASGASSGPPGNADVAAMSIEVNEQLQRLQNVLIPPAIALDVRIEAPTGGQQLDFGQLFLPGVLFMSFLFIAQGMSMDLWEERMRGTLRRALTTPHSAAHLLAGKLVAGATLIAAIAIVALVAATALFDVGWPRVPLALAWCVFGGAALLTFMFLLQTLATGQRGGELLSSLVVFPLMMIGGSFFPFEAMPAWMAAIGQWTPNGLAVLQLKNLLYGSISPSALGFAALGIGLPAMAAFALASRRLRGRFATA
jgi:ABC-type multidrug transport system permease subunit